MTCSPLKLPLYTSLAKCSNLIPLIPNIIRQARLAQVIQWFCCAVQCSCCCQAAVVQVKRSVGSDHVKQQLHTTANFKLKHYVLPSRHWGTWYPWCRSSILQTWALTKSVLSRKKKKRQEKAKVIIILNVRSKC